MTVDALMKRWKATPFRPFDVHLADGRVYHVAHPDFLARSPSGRTITIYQPDDSGADIDLLLVTALEWHANGSHSKSRRRR